MSAPLDARSMPRRDPLVQSTIELLQNADDLIRAGEDSTPELIAAQAALELLIQKHAMKRKT